MSRSSAPALEEMAARWRALQMRWDAAAAVWNDAVRVRFEREHWEPLAELVPTVLDHLDQLNRTIENAYRVVD